MQPPVSRYRMSERSFPEVPPPLEYAPDCQLRKVQQEGWLKFRGRELRVGQAFRGHTLGLRPTTEDGRWEVCFGPHVLGEIDLRNGTTQMTRRKK